jgi:hypothetical protein
MFTCSNIPCVCLHNTLFTCSLARCKYGSGYVYSTSFDITRPSQVLRLGCPLKQYIIYSFNRYTLWLLLKGQCHEIFVTSINVPFLGGDVPTLITAVTGIADHGHRCQRHCQQLVTIVNGTAYHWLLHTTTLAAAELRRWTEQYLIKNCLLARLTLSFVANWHSCEQQKP